MGIPKRLANGFDEELETGVRVRAVSTADEAVLRSGKAAGLSYTAADAGWADYPELDGVQYKLLHHDELTDEFSALLRLRAGARFPARHRRQDEQVLVLSGEVTVSNIRLGAGDYLRATAGDCWVAITSDSGGEFLLTGGDAGDCLPI